MQDDIDKAVEVLKATKRFLEPHAGAYLHCFWDDGNYDSLPDRDEVRANPDKYHWTVVKAMVAVIDAMEPLGYDEREKAFALFHGRSVDDDCCPHCGH